ncbi:MFS transporter [Streptomyces sp. NPDC091280]|uniref:MFS transporter n=1 Tax=Streptomyces sp. NPDC091280 TaxID=3365984 RepID=UPI0038287979
MVTLAETSWPLPQALANVTLERRPVKRTDEQDAAGHRGAETASKGKTPGHIPLVLASTFAYRTATGMGPLAILVTLSERQSLATASFALTCWTLAGALAQPLWVTAAFRLGQAQTLLTLAMVTALCHVAIAAAPSPVVAVVTASAAGFFLPPVTAQARGRIADLLEGEERERAYRVESALASLAFVVAPILVGGSRVLSHHAPMVAAAILLLGVSVVFAWDGKAGDCDTSERAAEHPDPFRAGASRTAVRSLIIAGAACYGMLACVEVAVVAEFDSTAVSSWVLAAWSLASLGGGLAASRLRLGRTRRAAFLFVSPAAYFLLGAGDAGQGLWFALVLVASGVAVSPTLALITSRMAAAVAAPARPQAFAWLQSSSWAGASAGTALAGLLASGQQESVMLLAGALALTVAFGLAAAGRAVSSVDSEPLSS